jgi:hypothetical protein
MNTKGASASCKSTMRPLQRRLAAELGVAWSDFAVVSPDIWRKYLLDYGALGDAYKYAGAFTAHELAIVDQKLDRYMARKAERGGMPHLLIDRFRFDSFAPDSEQAGSNLLTRFGREVYMFFLITPPHETVERAWRRGWRSGATRRWTTPSPTTSRPTRACPTSSSPGRCAPECRCTMSSWTTAYRPASARAPSHSAGAAS